MGEAQWDELLAPWLEATTRPAPVADAWTGEAEGGETEDEPRADAEEKARAAPDPEAAEG